MAGRGGGGGGTQLRGEGLNVRYKRLMHKEGCGLIFLSCVTLSFQNVLRSVLGRFKNFQAVFRQF